MTIERYQIHCLVSKNDAVLFVIEDDCDATMFQCRSVEARFVEAHDVKCDLDQKFVYRCSSPRVRKPIVQ